jgi:hypothetical protein
MKSFNEWYKTHECSKDTLWYIQNCLGDLYPESDNYKQAVKAWMNKAQGFTFTEESLGEDVGAVEAMRHECVHYGAQKTGNEGTKFCQNCGGKI